MVTPAQQRTVVAWARAAYQISERRACRAIGVTRSVIRYRTIRPAREDLRRRLHELAAVRVSYGYKQLHTKLLREGWRVNHKLVYRIYTEEQLTLKRRRPKKRKSAVHREQREVPRVPNERWAMDFIHDPLVDGRSLRVLAVIDVCSRECIALVPRSRFRGEDVVQILGEAARQRGLPAFISVDNGSEFTSRALDHWAYWNKVQLDFSRPGKPTDNAFIEAFNATLRRECLSQHWFLDIEEARQILETWKDDYNNERPHGSLQRLTPAQFRAGGRFTPAPERLEKLHI